MRPMHKSSGNLRRCSTGLGDPLTSPAATRSRPMFCKSLTQNVAFARSTDRATQPVASSIRHPAVSLLSILPLRCSPEPQIIWPSEAHTPCTASAAERKKASSDVRHLFSQEFSICGMHNIWHFTSGIEPVVPARTLSFLTFDQGFLG